PRFCRRLHSEPETRKAFQRSWICGILHAPRSKLSPKGTSAPQRKLMRFVWISVVCLTTIASTTFGQTQAPAAQLEVPRLIRFNGTLQVDGSTNSVGMTFALYK